MNDETIRVCDNCGEPMIFTFLFRGCERYCLMCGHAGGMLGTGEDVKLTTELEAKYTVIRKVFKVLSKYVLPNDVFYKNECEKCKDCKEHHLKHLTDEERFCNTIARKILGRISKNNEE